MPLALPFQLTGRRIGSYPEPLSQAWRGRLSPGRVVTISVAQSDPAYRPAGDHT